MLLKVFIDETFPVQPARAGEEEFQAVQEAATTEAAKSTDAAGATPQRAPGGDGTQPGSPGAPPAQNAEGQGQEEEGGPQEQRRVLLMWLVQEHLPLHHVRNVQALLQALHQPRERAKELEGLAGLFLYAATDGRPLDAACTPKQLGLPAGASVRFSREPPAAPLSHSPRQDSMTTAAGSPRADADEDEEYGGGRGPGGAGHHDEHEAMAVAAAAAAAAGDEEGGEEIYVSEECGWFPFLFQIDHFGQRVAAFINPDVEPQEDDPAPVYQQLCVPCSDLVARTDALRVKVDKHYKPMLMSMDIVEGWVEKLGGGTLTRWQRRYLCASEKSLDWYSEPPKVGVKPKIRGNRMFVDHGGCSAELIENPDPAVFPKCKEPKLFHFGIAFKDAKTMLFRVPSLGEKNKFVGFIKSTLGRIQNKGGSKDPVVWKKWADAFLTNAANVSDLSTRKDEENNELADDVAELERELAELQQRKPQLEEQRRTRAAEVVALKAELQACEDKMAAATRSAEAAERRVVREDDALRREQAEMSEEMRKAAMLEARTIAQRDAAAGRIAELKRELAELRQHHDALFARWRRYEEHHADVTTLPSQQRYLSFSIDGAPRQTSTTTTTNNNSTGGGSGGGAFLRCCSGTLENRRRGDGGSAHCSPPHSQPRQFRHRSFAAAPSDIAAAAAADPFSPPPRAPQRR